MPSSSRTGGRSLRMPSCSPSRPLPPRRSSPSSTLSWPRHTWRSRTPLRRSSRSGTAGTTAPPLDGYGYVVPRSGDSDVLACTWTSSKWENRAPAGQALLRVYLGRFGGRDVLELGDDGLVAIARDELRILGLDAEPTLVRVHRWPRGMPQYTLGHPERLARIESGARASPRPRARGRRLPRGRHPRLHPLGRARSRRRRARARPGAAMTRGSVPSDNLLQGVRSGSRPRIRQVTSCCKEGFAAP